MKDTMTEFTFCDWFMKSENRRNQFSFDALKSIYDYLINLEDDTGVEMEFDPVELCCNYSEYANFDEFQNVYSDVENFEDLENKTTVIKIPNTDSFIIQNY